MRHRGLFILIGISAVFCSGEFHTMLTSPLVQRVTGTSVEQHKALVRRWIDQGFNKRELSVVDELFSSEVIVNGQRVGGPGLKESMTRFIKAFPDLHVTITDVVAERDKVVIWYTVQGTQTGEFQEIRATGKSVRWSGADLFRFEKGKIVECRFLDDSLGLVRQLGATLSPPR
jgi:steroid delta-isomerase-like uncharacterized protein